MRIRRRPFVKNTIKSCCGKFSAVFIFSAAPLNFTLRLFMALKRSRKREWIEAAAG